MNHQIHRTARRDGFTLIELMIAVAIIGILASTAIAGYRNYQLRSKRSEAYINLKSLAGVQNAYFADTGIYAGALPMPGPIPQSTGRVWTPAAEVAFAVIGWRPEGKVFFDYDVNVPGGPSLAPCPCPECFTATAYGDTDGDAMVSVFMFVKPDRVGAFCPASVTGHAVPLDPMGQPMFDQPARNVLSDDF